MPNPFAYAELHAEDLTAVGDFYRQLFDWKVSRSEPPADPYVEFGIGDGLPGGVRQAGGPSHWVVYVEVADLGSATERAVSLGARTVSVDREIPGVGRYSLLRDPAGATFGLWQPTARG